MNLRLIEHNRYKEKNIIKNDSNIDYNNLTKVFISVTSIDHLKLICKKIGDFNIWEPYFNTYYKTNNYFKINFIHKYGSSYCLFQCKNCVNNCHAQNYKEIFIS